MVEKKVNEVKINIPTISKSEGVKEVNGKLLKELKSQKLIVSKKDKKFKNMIYVLKMVSAYLV
ncbi:MULTISPECIES: hypothetical protein [unclassified Clostridioides]|uniref:hypothetical protein n=1 Tax=unclassified Clostridioides TaxID=2635829 RepID=UPI001D1041E6|nr:hypothetical protein [Clostridioides sp. ES-S-0171-01]MCC0689855.1 hypothetical protein [Clostridioides sp. ES-S-0056-01]